jgi:hypothetical protein
MVTESQIRRLKKLSNTERTAEIAAAKAGMDPKTARKYLRFGKLPSELSVDRNWRTREDPFNDVWEPLRDQLEVNPGLEAKTLFATLQRDHPGRFADGQLRTLQRRVKIWRLTEGPPREVFFAQRHEPGRLCASDFTHMTELGITVGGRGFPPYDLPFRADVLELGARHGLLLGEFRESERGFAECPLATGWSAGFASHGQLVGGSEQHE